MCFLLVKYRFGCERGGPSVKPLSRLCDYSQGPEDAADRVSIIKGSSSVLVWLDRFSSLAEGASRDRHALKAPS